MDVWQPPAWRELRLQQRHVHWRRAQSMLGAFRTTFKTKRKRITCPSEQRF
jgi:hypothetical protein